MAKDDDKPGFKEKLKQFGTAFSFVRKRDKRFLPYLILAFLLAVAVAAGISAVTGWWLYVMPLGVLAGLVSALIVFNRRMMKSSYAAIEGTPGAAAAVIENMRGNWRVSPAVGFTPQQDMVHRVIGRPGVILLIEGSSHRVSKMITREKRRVNKVARDTPIYVVTVGDDADSDEVSIRGLQKYLTKLPKNITPKQINTLESRLSSLGGSQPPIPKTPIPTGARGKNMNVKMPRR